MLAAEHLDKDLSWMQVEWSAWPGEAHLGQEENEWEIHTDWRTRLLHLPFSKDRNKEPGV